MPPKMTLEALRGACIKKGLRTSGNKQELLDRLQNGFAIPFVPSQIISIDLGIRNCAAAVLDCSTGRLLSWTLTDLLCGTSAKAVDLGGIKGKKGFAPARTQDIVRVGGTFFRNAIEPFVTDKTLLAMERQRHRNAGAPQVFESILGNILLETVLTVLAGPKAIPIEPKSVAMYYNLPHGYCCKKKESIMLVEQRLAHLSPEHQVYFRDQKKKDDLADALLQAWALRDWISAVDK